MNFLPFHVDNTPFCLKVKELDPGLIKLASYSDNSPNMLDLRNKPNFSESLV